MPHPSELLATTPVLLDENVKFTPGSGKIFAIHNIHSAAITVTVFGGTYIHETAATASSDITINPATGLAWVDGVTIPVGWYEVASGNSVDIAIQSGHIIYGSWEAATNAGTNPVLAYCTGRPNPAT